jgi:hypothetical protein
VPDRHAEFAQGHAAGRGDGDIRVQEVRHVGVLEARVGAFAAASCWSAISKQFCVHVGACGTLKAASCWGCGANLH